MAELKPIETSLQLTETLSLTNNNNTSTLFILSSTTKIYSNFSEPILSNKVTLFVELTVSQTARVTFFFPANFCLGHLDQRILLIDSSSFVKALKSSVVTIHNTQFFSARYHFIENLWLYEMREVLFFIIFFTKLYKQSCQYLLSLFRKMQA